MRFITVVILLCQLILFFIEGRFEGQDVAGHRRGRFMYDRAAGVFKSDVFRSMFYHILKVYDSFMRIKRRICGFVMIRRGWLR